MEGPWELPGGWRWALLRDVVGSYFSGRRPRGGVKGIEEGPLSLGGEHLNWTGGLTLDTPRRIPASFAASIPDCAICGGDILIVKDGATTGKTAFVDKLPEPAFINEHVFAVRPTCEVEARFLFYWLWSQNGFNQIMKDFRGAAQGGIGRTFVDKVVVPVPPLDTQRRIAARINELFSELDDGEAALARARADLETYRKSLLKAAVNGELTADWRAANPAAETGEKLLQRILATRRARWDADPKNKGKRYKEPAGLTVRDLPQLPYGWTWSNIDQLILGLRNGVSDKPNNQPPGTPVFKISAVRELEVRTHEIRWLPADVDVGGATVKSGDLLFTRYNGSPDLVGVCGRYRGEQPVAYPDKLMRAVPVLQEDCLTDYFELAANCGETRAYIAEYTKTSAGQHGVSGETIKAAPVPLPPLAEAIQITRLFHEALDARVEATAYVQAVVSNSNQLRQSILAAAFRGELVQ